VKSCDYGGRESQDEAIACPVVEPEFLGDAIATFLGEGNWRPYRKAMVECWEADSTSHLKTG